jgi:hypothetical protein
MTRDPCTDYGVMLPPRRTDVRVYDFGGETVLRDPKFGSMNLLNETASAVWRCCDGAATISGIADHLAKEFEVDQATARDHVEEVISWFAKAGLFAEGT